MQYFVLRAVAPILQLLHAVEIRAQPLVLIQFRLVQGKY